MDKPLALYPGVLSSIPRSYGLLDETLKQWPHLHLSFWWDVIHKFKLAHSQQNLSSGNATIAGLPRSGKKFWKMKIFPGQGKVRELHFQSGKFLKKNEKSHEKSGNFKIFLKRC